MNRKLLASIFAMLLVLFSFVACEENSAIPAGTINVSISDSFTRVIEPNISLDVAKYEVTLLKGDGTALMSKELDKTNQRFSQNNIPVGSYTVKVDAKNSNGTVIGGGNVECVIRAGETTDVSVTVSELSGTGHISITLTGEVDAEISYTLSIYRADDTQLDSVDFTKEETGLKAEMKLENGFYYFVVSDSEGNSSTPEAFRIVKGDVLETEVNLVATEAESILITIINNIRPNPSLSLEVANSPIYVGEVFTVTATGMSGEDLVYSWYVNGNQVEGNGENITLNLDSEGEYVIRCLVKDSASSIVWSSNRIISLYDWTSQSTTEPNRYVEEKDTEFGYLTGNISKAWKYVDEDGNLVEDTASAARYIVEVNKDKVGDYINQKLFSSDSDDLIIGDFIYKGADKENKAYLELNRYPERYRYVWYSRCYWFEDGAWSHTGTIQSESDLIPILYKEISLDDNPTLKERLASLGNISVLYQSYKDGSPYCFADGKTDFIVEFSSTHANLNQVSQNDKGRLTDKVGTIYSIGLRKDTVGFAFIYLYSDNRTNICIVTEDSGSDKWYTSYTYLPLEKVGDSIRINGQDIDCPGFYDEEAEKYFSYSNWNGEKYWSEYNGNVNFEMTLSQLGDLESIQYFVGKTGQTKPFITTFTDSNGSYISMLGTYSSFNEDALSPFSPTLFQRNYFTQGIKAYDIDLDSDKIYVELDIFFKEDGTLSDVQIRIMTDKDNAKVYRKNYATTYKLSHSFLIEDAE